MAADTTFKLIPWVYDLVLWVLWIFVDVFFRAIHPRSSWKVPRSGPVIFVAAPHANQFVDPLILARIVRVEAKRRISFLIAAKSLKEPGIGQLAQVMGSVGVERQQDLVKPMPGTIYLPDPDNDPTLVRGVGTSFGENGVEVGGSLVVPLPKKSSASGEIAEIISPEELRVKKPFKGSAVMQQLTGKAQSSSRDRDVEKQTRGRQNFQGSRYKAAPKVDQTEMYDAVHERLRQGGCIGIFPEGGSHDRTELLPLKAGVAVMALGVLATNPDCGLKIVPCGMNYFHAHKFRSRAVIEFGTPLEIPRELVDEYKKGNRREAVGQTLESIYNALLTVTVTSPDYETLMFIQAVRRLYKPKNAKLPLPAIVELNRRLVQGYSVKREDPRIIELKDEVIKYNKQLLAVGVRDHQVEYARLSFLSVIATLFYRLGKLLFLSAAVLPGLVMFAPVFIAGKVISIRKSRAALAASSVKVQARDVVATWKILVSMALAPVLYTSYTILLTLWTYRNRVQGFVPQWVPLWLVWMLSYGFFASLSFAALRFGEIGMDIFKSLPPLLLALNPTSGNTLVQLRAKRLQLAAAVHEVVEELGPEVFPDFESTRLLKADGRPSTESQNRYKYEDEELDVPRQRRDSSPHGGPDGSITALAGIGGGSSFAGHIPRNESLGNLANIGLFSSQPQTPTSHSRSSSRPGSSYGHHGLSSFSSLNGFSTINSKEALDDVSKRIRGAMKERGARRVRADGDADDDETDANSGDVTPGAESTGLEIKKNR